MRQTEITAPVQTKAANRRRKPLVDFAVRLVKEKPLGTFGAIIILILIFTGIFANVLAPYDYKDFQMKDSLQPPSAAHLLGTDNLGRDLLSRIIFGARISMIAGLGGAAISVTISTLIGGFSGFLGGKVDVAVQRFVDAWMCFPALILIMTVMAILRPGLAQVVLVLGISGGVGGSRIVRGTVIGIKQNVYVEAARATGCPTRQILSRHILPNIMAPIIIMFSVGVGSMILSEATLSFLGFGLPPTIPSWGGMLSGEGRRYMYMAPWLAIWPGAALALVVYGVNMFGDALRDLLDPRLRGGLGRYGVKSKRPARELSKKQTV
ncbi:MAG: ABC transporter permease [Dehalococcoidia bacterium]|nr:ABC transporter permease [Dehalococcoidia bacterium]